MFAQQSCGCPVETSRYPYRCDGHAAPRVQTEKVRDRDGWYWQNTCHWCGRVNPAGLACAYVEQCPMCGITSCESHRMACYKLKVTCPREVNPRTKYWRGVFKAFRSTALFLAPSSEVAS